MSEVKWIKITPTMFEDEKIDFIESLPECDAILVIWIKVLTLAGKCNAGGFIMLTESIPYTDEMLAHKFKRNLNIVRLALNTFMKLGMIESTEKGFYITNWEKHQNEDKLSAIREYNRIAKRNERSRKLLGQGNVIDSQGDVNTQIIDIDIDKEIDTDIDNNINNNIIMTQEEAEYISILEKIKGYPLDRQKDIEYFKALSERYPKLDMVEVAKEFALYILANPFKKNSKARSQLNTSCQKYLEWGKCLKSGGDHIGRTSSNKSNSGTSAGFKELT